MSDLTNVHKGVSCVYYGLFLIVASILVAIPAAAVMMSSPRAGLAMMALVPLMLIAGTILGLVGRIICLAAPDEMQATGIIYAAVACDIVVVLISAAGWFVPVSDFVGSLSGLLSLAATVLFLIFLRQTATYIRDSVSERRAGNVMKLGAGAFVTVVLGIFLPPLLIVTFILVIVGFLIYVRLLTGLKASLKTA